MLSSFVMNSRIELAGVEAYSTRICAVALLTKYVQHFLLCILNVMPTYLFNRSNLNSTKTLIYDIIGWSIVLCYEEVCLLLPFLVICLFSYVLIPGLA